MSTADDFLEFGASGKVWSKAEIVSALPEWPASDVFHQGTGVA